jgi:hypothetical protein
LVIAYGVPGSVDLPLVIAYGVPGSVCIWCPRICLPLVIAYGVPGSVVPGSVLLLSGELEAVRVVKIID